MTAFGKVLVFLNLAAAVALLSWSASLYANRIDWVDRKSDTETVKGEITLLKEEIDKATRSIADAQVAYAAKSKDLTDAEALRDSRKRAYAVRLNEARRGTFHAQVYDDPTRPAFVNLRTPGPVALGPDNQPLRGVDFLEAEFKRQLQQAQLLREGQRKFDPNANPQSQLATLGIDGLRQMQGVLSDRIADLDVAIGKQKDVLTNLKGEAAFLADERVNWVARLQTLERRQQQLEDRLKQDEAK